jgi:hypothetical protein
MEGRAAMLSKPAGCQTISVQGPWPFPSSSLSNCLGALRFLVIGPSKSEGSDHKSMTDQRLGDALPTVLVPTRGHHWRRDFADSHIGSCKRRLGNHLSRPGRSPDGCRGQTPCVSGLIGRPPPPEEGFPLNSMRGPRRCSCLPARGLFSLGDWA